MDIDHSLLSQSVSNLSKVDLHVHLTGSITASTLIELAERNRVQLPTSAIDGIAEYLHVKILDDFHRVWGLIGSCVQNHSDYNLIMKRLLSDAHQNGVKYVEVRYAPPARVLKDESSLEFILAAIQEAIIESETALRTRCNLLLAIGREHCDAEMAEYIVRRAARYRKYSVVGIDLVGYEPIRHCSFFERAFVLAADLGLFRTIHAGEWLGAEDVWSALRLSPNRIGHGVHAVDDPELLNYLANSSIVLECCLTSNLRTGSCESIRNHPFKQFRETGVKVTLNTDDPGIFDTNMTQEMLLAYKYFGLDLEDLKKITELAASSAFLSIEEKRRLLNDLNS